MKYEVTTAPIADTDLAHVFDFLFESHLSFGYNSSSAFTAAVKRIEKIKRHMRALGKAPHQGTLQPKLGPHMRVVTKERAVFYFEVDDAAKCVRVLAVFFGAQDHQRAMLKRALGGG